MVSAGLIITDGDKFLVELPMFQTPGEHHYDIPKGHVEKCDFDMKDTAFRETFEETGVSFDEFKDRAYALSNGPVDYIKGKQIMLFRLDLEPDEMPALSRFECKSFFTDKKTGKTVPEVISFDYKPLREIRKWLFNSYSKSFNSIGLFKEMEYGK